MRQIIIDRKGNKKNNQHYAACLAVGGHGCGNHSDMDLILEIYEIPTDNKGR